MITYLSFRRFSLFVCVSAMLSLFVSVSFVSASLDTCLGQFDVVSGSVVCPDGGDVGKQRIRHYSLTNNGFIENAGSILLPDSHSQLFRLVAIENGYIAAIYRPDTQDFRVFREVLNASQELMFIQSMEGVLQSYFDVQASNDGRHIFYRMPGMIDGLFYVSPEGEHKLVSDLLGISVNASVQVIGNKGALFRATSGAAYFVYYEFATGKISYLDVASDVSVAGPVTIPVKSEYEPLSRVSSGSQGFFQAGLDAKTYYRLDIKNARAHELTVPFSEETFGAAHSEWVTWVDDPKKDAGRRHYAYNFVTGENCQIHAAQSGNFQYGRDYYVDNGIVYGKRKTNPFIKLQNWALSCGAYGNIPNFSLVKTADSSSVYYVAPDRKRYAFPSSKVFFSWYDDFSQVRTISNAQMSSLKLGGVVTYRPGSRMVKLASDPTVYMVDKGAVLRPVASEAAARDVYGDAWNTMIDDLSDAFYFSYTMGESVRQDEVVGGYNVVSYWKERIYQTSPYISIELSRL